MPDPREPLGRLVHEQRLAAEADRAAQEGRQHFLLAPWEERSDGQQEMDMRIGSALAAEGRRDAEKELIRLRLKVGALRRLYLDKPGRVADEDALRIIGAEEPCDA